MSILHSLYRHFGLQSLNKKFLLPIVGIMLVSMLASTLVFMAGTAFTRNQLLKDRLSTDTRNVIQTLSGRSQQVSTAAGILADNIDLAQTLQNKTGSSLETVDEFAVAIRNRFGLDLIQVYDSSGTAWTNLVLADLYQVSSLLGEIDNNTTMVKPINGRLLLLSRIPVNGNAGTIITGIDLETELGRIARASQMDAQLSIRLDEITVSTRKNLPEKDTSESVQLVTSILLNTTPVNLVIARSTSEINQITTTGLWLMVISSLVTTSLLIYLSSRIIDAIASPIQKLSNATQVIAQQHQFNTIDLVSYQKNILFIGVDDEVGQLAQSFNQMLTELRDVYQDLENKVIARTQQLTAASEVARATVSSLDLDTVLHTAVDLIGKSFNLSFVGVFLLNPEDNSIVLKHATGQVSLPVEQYPKFNFSLDSTAIIAQSIKNLSPIIINDYHLSSDFRAHPLMPNTHAEAVFPLMSGGKIIGALDVQSFHKNAFPPDLIQTFGTLSDQIAVAIQNAQSYSQQREITNRLAEIDHLKNQFLSTITHELRTPLNAIIGFSKLLMQGIQGEVNATQVADLTSIYENGQALLGMINNMIYLTALEAGETELHYSDFDFREEAHKAITYGRKLMGHKSIRMMLNLPENLPLLHADRTRIQHVLQSLMSNAVKFTETGRIIISAVHNTQWMIISVADTGVGISSEDQKGIFARFTQADGSLSRKFGGAGLGLTIARYIVELHGGKIWVESKLGEGSIFSFVLPIKPQVVVSSFFAPSSLAKEKV
ncbi:MAG TPA: ATP-binding protein [Anaerolineaceae bacterium]|nr:ATP-binding protein [Anaerolineaceae bacterium]HPN54129.1 ATP-binding protein [Anaerolineaceae bacterium]